MTLIFTFGLAYNLPYMVSVELMWLVCVSISYKMYNVTKCVSQTYYHIIKCNNSDKFRNDAYLAISLLLLLSYVVVVDA